MSWVPEVTNHCQETRLVVADTQIDLKKVGMTKVPQNEQKHIPQEQEVQWAKELKTVKSSALTHVCPADSKDFLMQSLEEFTTATYVFQFCNLLIENEDMHDKARNLSVSLSDCSEHDKLIMGCIKDIVARGFAAKVVEMIFTSLCEPKERYNKEVQLLLNCLDRSAFEEEEPSEYLDQLIRLVEYVMEKFYKPQYIDRVDKGPKRNLVILKRTLMSIVRYNTDQLLIAIFSCSLNKLNFSSTEKNGIGVAVFEGMPLIQELIKVASLKFGHLTIVNLQRRSALQFIKDLFVEVGMFKENIGQLDAVIQLLDDDLSKKIDFGREYPYESEGFTYLLDDYEPIEEFYKAGACHVPTEHTWWQEYNDVFYPHLPIIKKKYLLQEIML